MKKTKLQSGITLIALIITILVLLILAVVAIGFIKDGDVFTKAEQAEAKHAQAQSDEMDMINGYVYNIEMAKAEVGKVGELKVGDYINYNGQKYIVLHNDSANGLQIIATQPGKDLTLKGFRDVENRFEIFRSACLEYVNKDVGAVAARVLGNTFDEINGFVNTNTVGLKVVDGENVRLLKAYGTSATGAGPDEENAAAIFGKLKDNIGDNKIWCSTVYWGQSRWDSYYVDPTSREIFETETMATFSVVKGENDVLSAKDNDGFTCKVLPIILMDERIVITGGDGLTPETAYTYIFNG